MFKRTKIRLVLLNSLVLLLILNCFGAGLYLYTQHRLYSSIDEKLKAAMIHLEQEHLWNVLREKDSEREVDSRIFYLLWDNRGKLARQIPDHAFDREMVQKLRPKSIEQRPQTIILNGYYYRTLVVSVNKLQGVKQTDQLKTFQIVYSMQPEKEVLGHLLIVIEVGTLISVAIAIIVGLYLATRALVPIQLAWNKQQQFVADASHELRTPLTVIRLHLERLFRHPNRTIEQESEHISEVIHETSRISKMVSDLLLLARSDSNEIQLNFQQVQLDDLLNRVIQQFQDMAMIKGIKIVSSIDSSIEMIGDKERLHQLAVILLDNALKYIKERGLITLVAEKLPSSVNLSITDTGIGIPQEDLPFIFDRFYRGDKARTRTLVGTGLGLSIAKWIVEEHGGKIRVESKLGEGTTFKIILPRKAKI
jgi:two-component system sensor histidine kinase CiaH